MAAPKKTGPLARDTMAYVLAGGRGSRLFFSATLGRIGSFNALF